MRRLLLLTSALVIGISSIAANAFAVAPQFWRIHTAEEFLAGETEGFAVTSRGELRPAPAMKKLATFTDPFVLSQAVAPNGDRFFGTGNDGKIYRLRGSSLEVLFTAPEPEIYALAWSGSALLVGSSPNGKVYRVDPASGKHTLFFDPGQAYIWAIEPASDGVLVATGVEGQLFRVDAQGKGTVLYDAPDTHIRSLAVRRDGTVLAGASGKGRIYQISRDGGAIALFDSPLNEISSIHVDANGTGWASGVSNVLPSTAPAKKQQPAQQQQSGTANQSGEAKKDAEPSATVDVSFSFDDSSATAAAQSGASEVYRIDPDGFVDTARKFEREMVYGISGGPNGSILLATGPNGRIYEMKGGEIALLGAVPEKQVVSVSGSGSGAIVTTTNSGAVYRIDAAASSPVEFRSVAKDAERFSRFGNYRVEGRNLSGDPIAISFRSGNTSTPDATWSNWSSPQTSLEGKVAAPAARYVQWKLSMPKAAPDAAIDAVTVAFINRNVAPEIDAVAVQDPGVVFVSSAYPSSPQVLEATNPDEYGIFTSLDSPRERAAADQGKRLFRKGYRTVSWRASDDNGDTLHYTLEFRRKDSDRWLRLREKIEETQLNFDTSQLPDGRYELRLTASDENDNPDAALSDVKDSIEFEVDNTAPRIVAAPNGSGVSVRISDELSPIGRVEYSVDAEKWIPMLPVDGISDAREETFQIDRASVDGKFVVVRAVDGQYNVATSSITAR
jgi:hypothetical protein